MTPSITHHPTHLCFLIRNSNRKRNIQSKLIYSNLIEWSKPQVQVCFRWGKYVSASLKTVDFARYVPFKHDRALNCTCSVLSLIQHHHYTATTIQHLFPTSACESFHQCELQSELPTPNVIKPQYTTRTRVHSHISQRRPHFPSVHPVSTNLCTRNNCLSVSRALSLSSETESPNGLHWLLQLLLHFNYYFSRCNVVNLALVASAWKLEKLVGPMFHCPW